MTFSANPGHSNPQSGCLLGTLSPEYFTKCRNRLGERLFVMLALERQCRSGANRSGLRIYPEKVFLLIFCCDRYQMRQILHLAYNDSSRKNRGL